MKITTSANNITEAIKFFSADLAEDERIKQERVDVLMDDVMETDTVDSIEEEPMPMEEKEEPKGLMTRRTT